MTPADQSDKAEKLAREFWIEKMTSSPRCGRCGSYIAIIVKGIKTCRCCGKKC